MNLKYRITNSTPSISPGEWKNDGKLYLKISGVNKKQLEAISNAVNNSLGQIQEWNQ